MHQQAITANIHHYFVDSKTGKTHLDDEGEPKIGYYFQLLVGEAALGDETGPYNSAPEAEAAAAKAFLVNDY